MRSHPALHNRSSMTLRLWFARGWRRRMLCLVLIFGLLILPDAGYAVGAATDVIVQAAKETVAPLPVAVNWFKRLFRRSAIPPRQETLADRLAYVTQLQVTPRRFVGYLGQTVTFTALPLNARGETIQGVRFDWDASDTAKAVIDEAGRARLLQPGLVRITCHAGSVQASVLLLVRPGTRPRQSDTRWQADQQSLSDTTTTGANQGSTLEQLASLVNQLTPTAHAQNGWLDDLAYDELWNNPSNLVGTPRHRPLESTHIGRVMPEGSNFNFATSLIGLGGRGIGANLTLYYNSRLWSRRGNNMAYNAIVGWPAPGFSLGFGRLVTYELSPGGNPTCKYMLIDANGTRHYLGSGSWAGSGYDLGGPFESNDGSHIVYTGNGSHGGNLYYPDGTIIYFSLVNNRLLPTTISDTNGNYVQIAYKPECVQVGGETYCDVYAPMAIDYLIDTLGRMIQFNYDSNYRLTSITAPGFGGTAQNPVTQTVVQFDYQTVTASGTFSGLTVERGAGTVTTLKHIYFPATGNGYMPSYSIYGIITGMSKRRQMSIGSQNAIQDGVESNNVSFNYPTSGPITDAPAFTQRTESAVNALTATYSYASSSDGVAQTKTFTITRPDNSTLNLTRSTNSSSVANGLLVQDEIKTSGGVSMAKTVMAYVNDSSGEPQVQAVTSYDDSGAPTKMDFDYDSYGNITNTRQYGYQVSGQWQVRRRTRNVYKTDASYVNAYLRKLVIETDVYDAQLNTNDADDLLMAKTTFTYDDYQAMGGMEDYRDPVTGQLPQNPPGHLSWYGTSLTLRGNLTGTTQWYDLANNLSYTKLQKIDVFGNVVKEQLACCNEQTQMATQNTFWTSPEQVTKGSAAGVHLTSGATYDFNTLAMKTSIDPNSLQTSYSYDAEMRLTQTSLPTGATKNTVHYDSTLSATNSFTYTEGVSQKTVAGTEVTDGWGRVIQAVDLNNGQTNISYDVMGRKQSQTLLFAAGGTPGPAITYQYDVLDRLTLITLPDNNTIQTARSGNVVTVTDQVGTNRQWQTDGFGRLITVTEEDQTGALTQTTTYTYDLLDNLTGVNQGGQTRAYKYDALSRKIYERIPEQAATINDGTGTMWSAKSVYTDFNAVLTHQDARGVVRTNGYDTLNRLTSISYNISGAPGVAATNDVTYTYDNSSSSTTKGMLLSLSLSGSLPTYQETFAYDSYNRPTSRTWTRDGQSYTVAAQWNTADQAMQLTYPSGRVINATYDGSGRVSALADSGGGNYINNLAYDVNGNPTNWTLGNGVREGFAYSADRLQPTGHTAGTVSPYTNLMNLSYSYQAAAGQLGVNTTAGNVGQLISISGTINGTTESAGYTYDVLGRLTTAALTSNGASAQRRFDYDRWGNRTGVWDATSGGNQLQSIALQQSGGAPTNRIQTLYPPKTNFALAANGSIATASSTYSAAYAASAAINGDRKGTNWGEVGGGWQDATSNSYPDWLQVTFNGSKTIDEIDLFTLQDNYANPSEPTETMTFSQYGIVDFQVQYWNGLGWQTVSGGSITGNNKVWKKINFSAITTSKIRVNITSAQGGYSRVTEMEAWGPGVGINYTYDANGNVTNDGVHTYQYDAENRLVSVDSGTTASYAYDPQDRRIKKTAGATATHYIWQDKRVLAEHDASNGAQMIDYVYAYGKLIAAGSGTQATNAGIKYLLSDRMSERLTLDRYGSILGRQAHLPFGEDFAESGGQEKHHFTTYERDSESGNDYALNREYSPATGRFLSADPYTAGCSAKDPRGWNRYSYTRNVVINRIDPEGLADGGPIEGGCPPAGTAGTFPGKCLCQVVPAVCDKGIIHPNPDGHADRGEAEPRAEITLKKVTLGDDDYVEEFQFGGNSVKFVLNSRKSGICDDLAPFRLNVYFFLSDEKATWKVSSIGLDKTVRQVGSPEQSDLSDFNKKATVRLLWTNPDEQDDRETTVRIGISAERSGILNPSSDSKTANIKLKCKD